MATTNKLPMRPANWKEWSKAERAAWHRREANTKRSMEIERRLDATLTPRQRELFLEAESLEGYGLVAELELAAARLHRLAPELGDLIDFAVLPTSDAPHNDLVPTPGG